MQTIVGPDPACCPPSACRPRRSTLADRLGKRFARLRESCDGDGRQHRSARVREPGDDAQRARLGDRPRRAPRARCRQFFDEAAFLSPHGLRAVSKRYENNPYTLAGRRRARRSTTSRPSRRPACSAATRTGAARSGCRSTTSRSASSCIYQRFFGDDFTLEYPTGSGQQRTLRRDRAGPRRPAGRRSGCPDADGRRPVYGGTERLQTDPAWKDNLLFNEYFHGDNGAGLGATHQTGWTALVADLILDPPGSSEIAAGRAGRIGID